MTVPATDIGSDKEGYEYWGYLFRQDKTGTDKLRKLLRALHRHIGTKYEPYDSTDLTPTQLASFYRDVNGNYDPLFLSIPSATVQFIYKNLGCLHSLQPVPSSAADGRYADATIPSLKEEGWIMWETIQLLLGPDQHAGFLMNAVSKWELRDPDTGEAFPRILPRACFPAAPDAHMMTWYEGMSERLRRESEEEQNTRVTPVVEEEPRRQIEAAEKPHRKPEREHEHESSTESTSDSRKTGALAYFKNPLFRNNEGRPGVVRRGSKHPTFMSRGKSAAASVGHVLQNIGSPNLWSGETTPKNETHTHGHKDRDHREREHHHSHHSREHKDKERDREKYREWRRRSVPHNQYDRPSEEDEVLSPKMHPRKAALHSRRGSAAHSPASDREYGSSGSLRQTPTERDHQRQHSSPEDHKLRSSKSLETSASPKEYFPPYDSYIPRRGSAQTDLQSPSVTSIQSPQSSRTPLSESNLSYRERERGDKGRDRERDRERDMKRERGRDAEITQAGFMPTASPLFATHVARSDFRSGHTGPHLPPGQQQFNTQNYMNRATNSRERFESPARSDSGRNSSRRGADRRSLRVDSGWSNAPTGSKGSPPGAGYTAQSPPDAQASGYPRQKPARYDMHSDATERAERRRYAARDGHR